MLLKSLAVGAMIVFVVCLFAVLQGWRTGTATDHLAGVSFIVISGVAAAWGLRVLGWLPREPAKARPQNSTRINLAGRGLALVNLNVDPPGRMRTSCAPNSRVSAD